MSQLSPACFNRLHAVTDHPVHEDGEFVLCWLHHAIRDHENPALDAAITLGNAIGKPVLVYQGLGGKHRFNNDRHHVFIMQGARELQTGLKHRGVAYAFWLPRDANTPSPLIQLVNRACAIVTEDFPAPPIETWVSKLSKLTESPVYAVDCACVMPMRTLEKRYTRAFAFRRAAQDHWPACYLEPWEDVKPHVEPYEVSETKVGFLSEELQSADIYELAAECDIDHSIPPVRAEGGSQAGYQRWNEFVANHLNLYDDLRNDASNMNAVSGLSPYLHHGHVSPLRIAREAASHGGSSADKFLDELLTWRELAHNFCLHTPIKQLHSLDSIPNWARETLEKHAKDQREEIFSWEELSQGKTGYALWDAAQRSLLRNGELHNNMRVTWGKTLLKWTRSPQEALQILIDLNHRYALDGSDPNSYGGLLWCLGQFDRPFPPDASITGTVRGRSLGSHAKRLKPERYAASVANRESYKSLRVAIIGAGISGLACAKTLENQGCQVTIFDRGRSVGGRMSSRQIELDENTTINIDHGAPWFTVTDPRFGRYVRSWIDSNRCKKWETKGIRIKDGIEYTIDTEYPKIIGIPNMNAIGEHLADGIDIHTATVVEKVTRQGECWYLHCQGQLLEKAYDAIVFAMAPEQSARLLLPEHDDLKQKIESICSMPEWVIMTMLESRVEQSISIIETPDDEHFTRLVRCDTKSGRSANNGIQTWVGYAQSQWSKPRYDQDRKIIADQLQQPLLSKLIDTKVISADVQVKYIRAHRWGASRPAQPIEQRCLFAASDRLALCGDGFGGSSVETAFLSGQAAAGRVLQWRYPQQNEKNEKQAPTLF